MFRMGKKQTMEENERSKKAKLKERIKPEMKRCKKKKVDIPPKPKKPERKGKHTPKSKETEQNAKLKFHSISVSIPHPEKLHRKGEDASFINSSALAVFDGVGGSMSRGVNSGTYSRALASLTGETFFSKPNMSIKSALKTAARAITMRGSTTACVAELYHGFMRGINVGDSALWVIREGQIVFKTTSQQHRFNMPYQIRAECLADLEKGEEFEFAVRKGDVAILASDGLWDNVFADSISKTVKEHQDLWIKMDRKKDKKRLDKHTLLFEPVLRSSKTNSKGAEAVQSGARVSDLAFHLSSHACKAAHSHSMPTPFQKNSAEEGSANTRGGKLDDITILVSLVVDSESKYSRQVETVSPKSLIS